VDKLRAELAKARRRPVGDGVWRYLEEMGFVGEAEQMPLAKGGEYLKEQWRRAQQAVGSDSGVPISLELRDAAFNARADALAAIYAAWAAENSGVQWFRQHSLRRADPDAMMAWIQGGPQPGYELLAEDDVAGWVLAQYRSASATGDGADKLKELISTWKPGTESPVVHLEYVDGDMLRKLTVPRRGTLGDLEKLSVELAKKYRWHPAFATLFVLTGAEPLVSTFSASAEVRYGIDNAATTRVTLSLDPFLSIDRVTEIYAEVRRRLEPEPARRAQSLRAYRLAQHVGPHVMQYSATSAVPGRRGRPRKTDPPGGIVWYIDPIRGQTWSSLRQSWNQKYPDQGEDGTSWKYSELSNFTKEAQEVLLRLLDPQWGLRRLPQAKQDLS
jgi:hypothetical protein